MTSKIGRAGTHALYDPDQARADAQEHFSSHLTAARQIVRESADLLLRAFSTTPDVGVMEMVILGHFFRSLVVAADGCLLCLEAGAAEQALLHTRKALETGLQLQWILRADTESRATRFYVGHLREERSWYRRAIPGSPEHDDHVAAWKAADDPGPEMDEAEATRAIASTDAILARPVFAEIDEWFSEAKVAHARRKGITPEPLWHAVGPDAVSNLRRMSQAVGRYTEYRTTYRHLSYAVHSSSLSSSVRVKSSELRMEHIRFPRHFSLAFVHGFTELVSRAKDVAIRYRPEEVEDWKARARRDWYGPISRMITFTTPHE